MVCEICKDETFLAQKAEPATENNLGVAQDLLDILIAYKDGCLSPVLGKQSASKLLRYSGRMRNSRHASRPLPDGR